MTWARIVELLLELLNSLKDYLAGKQQQKEAEDAQKEQNKIESNPVGWFDEHFNGVRAQSETVQKSDSGQATASKSDPK